MVAGVFYAFSTFVMKALARLPPREGIAAMQSINDAVLNAWFLGPFFGTGVACVLALIGASTRWEPPASSYLIAGGVLYLAGTLGVTMAFNVPKNEALSELTPTDATNERRWANYVERWTAWNHVRTAAALAAAASFTIGLCH